MGRARDVEEFKKVDPRQLVAGVLTAMERYGLPRPSERTTSQPMREIDSWSPCGSYALTLSGCMLVVEIDTLDSSSEFRILRR